MKQNMKAIALKSFGDISNLQIEEIGTPEINENEVLINVKAISINPVDVKTRMGKGVAKWLKDEHPVILGWDISGVITRIASGVKGFKVGDEVFGMVNFVGHGRAYAEYVAAPADQLALKPAHITHEEAAAATLTALTAYQGLVSKGKVKAGQRVLVHAAAGGVGHYAVQIARHLGAYVIGTSSAANKDFVLSLGAHEHIDYKAKAFKEGLALVDFVLDTVGGDNIDRSLEVVKRGGTVISIPSGLNEAVSEKAKAKGVNGYFFLVESNGRDMQALAALLEKGILKSHVSSVFDFTQMGEAHTSMESGHTKGKIIVTV
jgi:NADPH:quinone reductase-like Zn-dependent oxidoreductase